MKIYDVVIIGSGSAACAAALKAGLSHMKVLVVEKSGWLGGTSAMSGAGVWIPANHIGAQAGVEDSEEEALTYMENVLPDEMFAQEERLIRNFIRQAPEALHFICENTPLDFHLIDEPDPYAEAPGGKKYGRMLSPMPLSRRLLGPYGRKLRRSTLPHIFTYQENINEDLYHHPVRATIRLAPKLLWRWLKGARAQGSALMTGLIRGCLDAGVIFMLETRAVRLIKDEQGDITGVEVEGKTGQMKIGARCGVIIASGGFEWNNQMRERYFPQPVDRIGTPSTNEGDGHRLAVDVGAKLDLMDQANIYVCLPTRYEGKNYGLPINFLYEPHSILVNRDGKRFVSEAYFNVGELIDARTDDGRAVHLPCYLIGDHRFLRSSLAFRWYASYEPDWIQKADSVEELASKLKLPAEKLAETIKRWNTFCVSGKDEDFHRGETIWERKKDGNPDGSLRLKPIDKPPYIGMSVNRSLIGTKGGIRTNEQAQVLAADGSVIPGLYAAGLAMANPIGTRAVGAGTTLGPNLTWGYIAAETILKRHEIIS